MTHADREKAIRQECLDYCHRRSRIKTIDNPSIIRAYREINRIIYGVCLAAQDGLVIAPDFCDAMIDDIAYCRGYGASALSKHMSQSTYKRRKTAVKNAIADLFGFK